MLADPLGRELLIHGTLLFLLGLLNGVAVQGFRNPRMGLSAHLAGVQNGLVLWAFGLLWPQCALSPGVAWLAAWSAILSMYAIWFGLLLAAIWGTSRSTPIAGAGHAGSPGRELTVTALISAGSVAIIVATGLVLYGLL